MRFFTLFFLLAAIAGCSAPQKSSVVIMPDEYPPAIHEVIDARKGSDKPKFLSCDYTRYQNNYNEKHNKAAVKAYKFSLMASNAYHDNAYFTIKDWSYVSHFRGKEGSHHEVEFQADIYEHQSSNVIDKVAIVFRGTDGKHDWDANLALATEASERKPAQYHIAKNLFDAIRAREKYKDAEFYLVGHSLGGSLAYHVSWYYEGVHAFTFNASERKWVSGKAKDATRYVLREDDEILTKIKFIRLFSPLAPDTVPAEKFDFSLGNGFRQHNMYYFARGLLLLAAVNGDNDARDIITSNLRCPQ